MLAVEQTMDTFLNCLRNKTEGGPFSRFKSWEYCHKQFLSIHNKGAEATDEEIDYLALHLSFYLASWGMYRGSSFILQRDYKTHVGVVKEVLQPKYADLWDFDPLGKTDSRLREIADLAAEAYDGVSDAYGDIPERFFVDDDGDEDKPISITLITKILMGTFAISPAFDRFFKDGIRCYSNHFDNAMDLGPFTHYNNKKDFSDDLVRLFRFANRYRVPLNDADKATSFAYPMMKKVDMYFWELGYEFGFLTALRKKRDALTGARCFQGKKAEKPYIKIIEQIKALMDVHDKVYDDDHAGTMEDIITFLEERLGENPKKKDETP